MRCPSCQTDLSPGGHFCSACGYSILQTHGAYVDGLRAFCDGNYEESLRKLKVALLTDPTNPEITKDLGHAYLHCGDLRSALDCYEKSELLGGPMPDADYNRSVALLQSHHWKLAGDLLQRVLGHSGPLLHSGQYYLGLAFPSELAFRAECHVLLGVCCRQQGDIPGASDNFRAALAISNNLLSAHHHLGDLLLRAQNYREAIQHFEAVVSGSHLNDELILAHNNLGVSYYAIGQTEAAIRHLNLVLERDRGNPNAIHNLNHIYEQEGILRPSDDGTVRAARFMELAEAASPIFGLVQDADLPTNDARTRGGFTPIIVGRSAPMRKMIRSARLAAASDSTVLITGENGTGKELVARLIYLNSHRAAKPFVVVNCAAIPETLLESELFGHERGAFTGAVALKPGRFEVADEGTIFLDEIGELSLQMQVKLLRVIQQREFTRVGGNETIRVDVRIIAATNRELLRCIAAGTFREDLFYRLNVLPIHIPPLRERREDIPLIVEYFLKQYSKRDGGHTVKFNSEEMAVLMDYHWPGNVRELENTIERAIIMGSQANLLIEELGRLKRASPRHPSAPPTSTPMAAPFVVNKETVTRDAAQRVPPRTPGAPVLLDPPSDPLRREDPPSPRPETASDIGAVVEFPTSMSLAEVEKMHILRVLKATKNNQRQTAKILGINASTLWRKLRQYKLEPPSPTESGEK